MNLLIAEFSYKSWVVWRICCPSYSSSLLIWLLFSTSCSSANCLNPLNYRWGYENIAYQGSDLLPLQEWLFSHLPTPYTFPLTRSCPRVLSLIFLRAANSPWWGYRSDIRLPKCFYWSDFAQSCHLDVEDSVFIVPVGSRFYQLFPWASEGFRWGGFR